MASFARELPREDGGEKPELGRDFTLAAAAADEAQDLDFAVRQELEKRVSDGLAGGLREETLLYRWADHQAAREDRRKRSNDRGGWFDEA